MSGFDQINANQDIYAVILAGGSGTRFWPKSRHLLPKQLCKIGSNQQTMLEITLNRLEGFIPPERRIIVTHQDQIEKTKEIAGRLCRHYLAEPEARNTANALALAALQIKHIHKGKSVPIMVSLHADHIIEKVPAFLRSLEQAVKVAQEGLLTLVGIVPEYPETGYGYIEQGPAIKSFTGAYNVASFREKPEFALASKYVASKNFYWNAGMFVWRVDMIIEELNSFLKPSMDKLSALLQGAGGEGYNDVSPKKIAEVYGALPKISIDNAVLEVSKKVAVVPADIGWQDVGSWDALSRTFTPDSEGNLLFGNGCLIGSKNTTIDSDGPFVAALGVNDHVIVHSGGAILVCPKEKAQDVKLIVDWLKSSAKHKTLV
jgi:mannose-1-phosphate guanylyltransferase